jgi:hypothetical protein
VVETMSVVRTPQVPDGAGGFTPGTPANAYASVPVAVEIDKKGNRVDAAGKLIALQTYILTFPSQTTAGALIDIDLATDRLVVDARSPQPAKTYKIVCPAEEMGVVNAYVCVKED